MKFSDWKNVQLQDVVSKLGDGLHGTPKYDENGEYFFINGNNLVDGKVVIKENTKRVSVEEYKKYKKELNDRTILLGINGTIGNVALYENEKCVLGKSACYFNVVNSVDKQFVKYVITNNGFQSYIQRTANGTTIKNVSLKSIREFEFPLPDLKTQKRIASILSSLDDAIELNQQTNKTLEEIAQTLFREMCLPKDNELPKGWRVGKLGEVVEIKGGTTPSTAKKEYWDGEFCWVTPKDLSNLQTNVLLDTSRKITAEGVKQIGSGILPKGTLLLSSRAPIGYLAIAEIPISINQGFIAINGVTVSNLFMLYWLKQNMQTILNNANGSTFLEISKSVFRNIEITIPSITVLKKFDEMINGIYQQILNNEQESKTLILLRDLLLPKLMKGEIEINKLNFA
jgi:type I restriction enzyme S subunit